MTHLRARKSGMKRVSSSRPQWYIREQAAPKERAGTTESLRAAVMRIVGWWERQYLHCRHLVLWCLFLCLHPRHRLLHRAGGARIQWLWLSLGGRRETILLLRICQGGLPVSWLLFVGGGLCAGGIWPTFADRCGTLQCLLHIVGFGWLLGAVDRLLSRQAAGRWCPDLGDRNLVPVMWNFTIECRLCSISSASCCCIGEEATHMSRAALRPGTAAVVKRSAGLDCASVSPLGSVVMPGSASLSPPKTAWTHAQCSREASVVLQSSPCSSSGTRMIHKDGTGQSPPKPCCQVFFCTLVMQSCGVRTLPAHASEC